MASSLGYIGGFGFAGFFLVAMVLVKNGIPPGSLVAITFFYFAALFGVCYFVAKQAGVLRKPEQRRDALPGSDQPSYLRPVTTAQLEESRQTSVGSITDHTTRTLDEISIERK